MMRTRCSITYAIHHDAGGSYPAGYIVFDGTTRTSFLGRDGGLSIAFDEETGEASATDVAWAREFVALRARAEEVMRRRALVVREFRDEER